MHYPEAVENLIERFKHLPGIGRRGAERLVLALLDRPADELVDFGKLISSLPAAVGECPTCGALAEAGAHCAICADARRDLSQLCVVETMAQLFAVEKGGNYHGRYLVLGGRISPLDGEDGSGLRLDLLRERASSGEVKEVILALSSDVEGRATAAYLTELLADLPIRLSRPALGLPAGANLSFADGATIAAAFTGRIEVPKTQEPGK